MENQWPEPADHRHPQLTTEVTREYHTSDQEIFAGVAEELSRALARLILCSVHASRSGRHTSSLHTRLRSDRVFSHQRIRRMRSRRLEQPTHSVSADTTDSLFRSEAIFQLRTLLRSRDTRQQLVSERSESRSRLALLRPTNCLAAYQLLCGLISRLRTALALESRTQGLLKASRQASNRPLNFRKRPDSRICSLAKRQNSCRCRARDALQTPNAGEICVPAHAPSANGVASPDFLGWLCKLREESFHAANHRCSSQNIP